MKNYYELLQAYPNSTAEEIKDHFRMLLFRYHPDHNRDREDWAVQRTMELVEAYHVLSDPYRRAHHDVARSGRPRDLPEKKGGLKGLFARTPEKTAAAEAHCRRGLEAFRADEYDQSLAAFRKAQETDGACPHARFNAALAYLALDRLTEAMQALQEHAAREKEDAEARSLYSKIGQLLQKRKASAGSRP